MRRFEAGDRVRIDIPDEADPDHGLHGQHGEIVEEIEDDADVETSDKRDSTMYRVQLDTDEEMDFRWRDLRPPFDSPP